MVQKLQIIPFLLLCFSSVAVSQPATSKQLTGSWKSVDYSFLTNAADSAMLVNDTKNMGITFYEDSTYSTFIVTEGVLKEISSGDYELSNDGKFIRQNDDSLTIISFTGQRLVLSFDNKFIISFDKINPDNNTVLKNITLGNIVFSNKKPANTFLLSDKKNRRKPRSEDIGFMAPDCEIAQSFSLPGTGSIYKIKKIFLPLIKKDCWGSIVVHIYARQKSDSLPGEELMTKKVNVAAGDVKRGKLRLDVSQENITFSGGESFFLSFESSKSVEQPCLTGTMLHLTAVPNFLSRSFNNYDSKWKTEEEIGLTRLSGHIENWHGQMFAEVEVEEYK